MESALIIKSVDGSGNKYQKTVSNINPDATTAQLDEFAQRVTALTTNTYTGASLIDKINVVTETRLVALNYNGNTYDISGLWDTANVDWSKATCESFYGISVTYPDNPSFGDLFKYFEESITDYIYWVVWSGRSWIVLKKASSSSGDRSDPQIPRNKLTARLINDLLNGAE